MAKYHIMDAVSGAMVATVQAGNGLAALKKFQRERAMSTGIWEYHKAAGIWTASTTYGAYFIARKDG